MILYLVLISMGSSTNACAGEPAYNVRDHIPLEQFVIQAHRGCGLDLPENTIECYLTAWQWGVVPEADVRTSQDGVICAFHDNNFARLAKHVRPEWKKKRVGDLTWRDLQQIDVGMYAGQQYAGQHIAKIEDAFKEMAGRPDRCLYLDIKDVSLPKLAKLVNKFGVQKQVIFATSRFDLIQQWKKIVPQSQTLLWMGGSQEELAAKLAKLAAADYEGITTLQIHVHLQESGSPTPFSPSPDFLRDVGRKLRDRNITYQTLPWKTMDPKVYHALLDLGVQSFASDHPRITQQAVKDYYEKYSPAR